MTKTYLAVAYRWGWLNSAHYFVYGGPDRDKAIALAQAENDSRGGKYGCVVYEFSGDGEDQEQREIAYFPSVYGEKRPSHNRRIDLLQSLGLKFEEFISGKVWLPEGGQGNRLTPLKVKPPQWAKDEYMRQSKICELTAKIDEAVGRKKI